MFQNICHRKYVKFPAEKNGRGRWSHASEPLEKENAIPLGANGWRWLPPPPPRRKRSVCSFKNRKGKEKCQAMLVEENAKGVRKKNNFVGVWKQIKSRAMWQLSLIWWQIFLNILAAPPAQWPSNSRETERIFLSIWSVIIRLARLSSSSCVWISGQTRAGVAHVPGLLRVPLAICQYAQDDMDQSLLNHFPNRGNDNYKKWRLCTLYKCCAMTLEPNGSSY